MKNSSVYSEDNSHRFHSQNKWNGYPYHGRRHEDGFPCKKCGFFVTANPGVSGVQNRNHCPCCLWSRHMDLFKPGDRLSACKALMRPIGLTVKRNGKKYGNGIGELMLVHECNFCNAVSINRVAADDIPQILLVVLETTPQLVDSLQITLKMSGINLLSPCDSGLVQTILFGGEIR